MLVNPTMDPVCSIGLKNSMTTKSTKCSLFQTLRELSVNRKDLQALTLVGPTRDNPVPNPLAVLHLNN